MQTPFSVQTARRILYIHEDRTTHASLPNPPCTRDDWPIHAILNPPYTHGEWSESCGQFWVKDIIFSVHENFFNYGLIFDLLIVNFQLIFLLIILQIV